MTIEVNLYYANWCGHCQKFKPEWEALKTKLDDLGITHNEYEDGQNKDEINAAKVKGFPTIRIKTDEDLIEYNGPRTAPDILNFMGISPAGNKSQTGGSSEYKGKYMKYKAKYLTLKKWMDENGY